MEPTQKSPGIEHFITETFGDRRATIQADKCMSCGNPATDFRNDISRREYRISGLCQMCQDGVFGAD